MTQDEIYNAYVIWSRGCPEIAKEELFRMPAANRDVYESANVLVNHLYFLIIKCTGVKTSPFVFYEANTFFKKTNGDLVLMYSTYCLPEEIGASIS